MLIAVVALAFGSAHPAPPPSRLDRLVALARLDAAVHYFDPAVATRASNWDSLFAANVVSIADAKSSTDYRSLITSLMQALPANGLASPARQRALVYNGFPNVMMQSSGGYGLQWRSTPGPETYSVDMGEGVHVDVPLSEPNADTTTALKPLAPPVSAEWRAAYPSVGYRILAAARIWSTIRLFYPYKALIGENWDAVFRAALPEFERAHDALEYAQAVARFSAHIHDTHVSVNSATLMGYLGVAPIGAAARFVEDQLVITRIVDSSASRAGLRVGDVVVSIDGEPTTRRVERFTPFLAVSAPQSLRYRLESGLLRGTDSTPARLVVRDGSRADRTLSVQRSTAFAPKLAKHRGGSIIRILPGNVGYIDLDRLPQVMIDSAFRVLANTKAIVLDDRGYPLGTAWGIAPRLNAHGDSTVAAKFRRLIVPSPDTARTTIYEFDQPIPPSNGVARYTGRTVMLVDERTISQAEHTGLFFEAANGTTFIGSPTMGANGDVTLFAVPGGINVTFTGHDVRHADERQLQRVGLQPQVAAVPTIAGIRAGRDEVLETAVKYLGGTGVIPPDAVTDAAPVVLAALPAEPQVGGWLTMGSAAESYRVGRDGGTAHGGSSSGHITPRTAMPDGFVTLAQLVKAHNYRGKRVRFSAFVKTRAVTRGAALWMRIDGNGGMLAFDNMTNRLIMRTTDWTRVSVVLDVPADADGMALGILLTGDGEAWIDDASLEVVGPDVPSTNMTSPMPDPSRAEQVRRQYEHAPLVLMNPGLEPG